VLTLRSGLLDSIAVPLQTSCKCPGPLTCIGLLTYNGSMTKTPTLKTQTYRVDRSHYSDTLDQLHTVAGKIEDNVNEEHRLAKIARQEGATWEDIGRELGVTRSAAQQRFGR